MWQGLLGAGSGEKRPGLGDAGPDKAAGVQGCRGGLKQSIKSVKGVERKVKANLIFDEVYINQSLEFSGGKLTKAVVNQQKKIAFSLLVFISELAFGKRLIHRTLRSILYE